MQTAKLSTHQPSWRVLPLSSDCPGRAPASSVPSSTSRSAPRVTSNCDSGRSRQTQILGLHQVATVGLGDGGVRRTPQYDAECGIAHRGIVDEAAQMDGHAVLMNRADRQQIPRARLDSPGGADSFPPAAAPASAMIAAAAARRSP